MDFKTSETEDDSIVIIKLPDRVSADGADDLKGYIKQIVEKGKYKLVINLEDTNFIDSAGLGAIVSKISVTRANHGDVRMACAHDYITNLMELTHLDQIIKIYNSVKEAVESYREE